MISLSSGEAESYAESACAAKLLGLAELVKEPHSTVSVNYETDTRFSTIRTSETNTRRSKHIEVRCLAIRSWIRDKRFAVGHVHAKNNTADILTKYLDGPLTPSLSKRLGKRVTGDASDDALAEQRSSSSRGVSISHIQ